MKSSFAPRLRILLLFVCSIDVCAHQGSTSYVSLAVEEDRIKGRWEIPVQDLDLALGLDSDKNRKVTLNELQHRFLEVKSYALRHLRLTVNGASGELVATNSQPIIEEFHDGASMALDFVFTNISYPTNLEVEYRFMFDRKPEDRAFMQVECRRVTQTGSFTADQPVQRFDLEARKSANKFRTFGWHSAWHVWAGLDHYLFLLTWLLPAVLCREQNQWQAVVSFAESFMYVFKAVTAFTVANLVTLSLAALQLLTLPVLWAESAIAVTIVLAAVNNIRTIVRGQVWMLAFALGLIHGLGFTNMIPGPEAHQSILMALLSFTLGMEAGQLVIALAILPLVFALRRASFYRSVILKGGSAIISILAGLWLVERLLNLTILRV